MSHRRRPKLAALLKSDSIAADGDSVDSATPYRPEK